MFNAIIFTNICIVYSSTLHAVINAKAVNKRNKLINAIRMTKKYAIDIYVIRVKNRKKMRLSSSQW